MVHPAGMIGGPRAASPEARRRIMAARILAQSRWPYVSTLLFAVRLVEVDPARLPTVAVDRGWRLYYSPEFVLGCTPEQLATVLLHECQHLMLDHADRFDVLKQPRENHPLWNLAGDAVINRTLDEAGMPWPAERGIRYSDLADRGVSEGMTTEAAYFALLAAQKQRGSTGSAAQEGPSQPRGASNTSGTAGPHAPSGAGGAPSPAGGHEDGSGTGAPGHAQSPTATNAAVGHGAAPQQGSQPPPEGADVLRGGCGSGAGGQPADYELARDDEAAPEAGHAQRDLVRDRVAQDVLARQKSVGDVPAGLARWAEELLHPVIDWRSVLAGLLRSALASSSGRRDFSYRVPSRRAQGLRPALAGAILPAMRQPPPPTVAAVLDTSGSIAPDELRAFLSEVLHIVRSVGVRDGVTTIPCDARAYEPRRIRREADALGVALPGGGGTDMGAGLVAACALRPRPDVIVVFTDGLTPWPGQPPHPAPHYVVAITPEGAAIKPSPPWAQRLTIEASTGGRAG